MVAFNFKIQIIIKVIIMMKLLIAKSAAINSKCHTNINTMLLDSITWDELEAEALGNVIKVCQLCIMEITAETSFSHISITMGTTELQTHPCCLPAFSKTVGTCTTKTVSKTLVSNMKAETEASRTTHKHNHIWTRTSASNKMNLDNGDQTKTKRDRLPSRLHPSLGSTSRKRTADRTYMRMGCKGSCNQRTPNNNTHWNISKART